MRRRTIRAATAALIALVLFAPGAAPGYAQPGGDKFPPGQHKTLSQYAEDTWQSFVMLTDSTADADTDPDTGLPADNVDAAGNLSAYTSPTNIGTYLWSTIAARDLGIITPEEARERIAQTLDAVEGLERHEDSGMFYNWYNPATGEKLTVWPVNGDPVYPFLSSVDNGWLAAALFIVAEALPEERERALALAESMDFGFYYDPAAGLLRGGFWVAPPPGCSILDNYRDRGADVYYTCHHYGALNTEPRIASYIAIAKDGVPPTHYFKMWRTFPANCDWSWQEMRPGGETRTYLGVEVFEGHYRYDPTFDDNPNDDLRLVPSWGGSMFEALMVPLLVPEEEWGPRSWGVNHPLYVEAQILHGLKEADYGFWGFSPSNNPAGGYREYGVDAIGLNPDGYTSDQDRTLVNYGFEGCRPGEELLTAYGDGVVTPHASFLALDFAPNAALKNLSKLRKEFPDIYGEGGFYDAIAVESGQISRYYLALDQGMIMAAIANELTGDRFQDYFAGTVDDEVAPLLAMEEFTAGRGD